MTDVSVLFIFIFHLKYSQTIDFEIESESVGWTTGNTSTSSEIHERKWLVNWAKNRVNLTIKYNVFLT